MKIIFSKNSTIISIALVILGLAVAFVSYMNRDNNLYPDKEFNKIFIPNTKIYNDIQMYVDKMLYQYSGIDRIHIFTFHNGTEDIRQIPYLKESIQLKSLKDEKLDVTEFYKGYPISQDLFKINSLFNEIHLQVGINIPLIPSSLKSQLDKTKTRDAIYHLLISNEGTPFGYIALENVNTTDFKFTSKDSSQFIKDINEIESKFDKLLKENKKNYSQLYTIVTVVGFSGLIILFVIIGFIISGKATDEKFEKLISFLKPKLEVIADDLIIFTKDIKRITERLEDFELKSNNIHKTLNDVIETDKIPDDITLRFAELIKNYVANIEDFSKKKIMYKCGVILGRFYIKTYYYQIKPKTYNIITEVPEIMFTDVINSINKVLEDNSIVLRQTDRDLINNNEKKLFDFLNSITDDMDNKKIVEKFNSIIITDYLSLMENLNKIIQNRKLT